MCSPFYTHRLIAACARTSHALNRATEGRRLLDPKVNPIFRVLWNYQYRFAYCPIPKAGTTTWLNIMFDMVPWLDPGQRWREYQEQI